jgi:hypothetical protein
MGMTKDPGNKSDAGAEDLEAAPEDVTDPDRPPCPRCGWHNTRLSHTRSLLDPILRAFSLRAYRCRSCGNRFRARCTPSV